VRQPVFIIHLLHEHHADIEKPCQLVLSKVLMLSFTLEENFIARVVEMLAFVDIKLTLSSSACKLGDVGSRLLRLSTLLYIFASAWESRVAIVSTDVMPIFFETPPSCCGTTENSTALAVAGVTPPEPTALRASSKDCVNALGAGVVLGTDAAPGELYGDGNAPPTQGVVDGNAVAVIA
jgi:hypothetical protein